MGPETMEAILRLVAKSFESVKVVIIFGKPWISKEWFVKNCDTDGNTVSLEGPPRMRGLTAPRYAVGLDTSTAAGYISRSATPPKHFLAMSNQPNTTLYINNLNDKVNKEELRSQLYALFTTYGKIIDVIASKGPKMKGQAFLVFTDLAGATAALRACEGMQFYDKPLVSTYQHHSRRDLDCLV